MSVVPSDLAYYASLASPAFDGAATLNGAIASTTATSVPINAPTSPFPSNFEFDILVDSEVMRVTQGFPGNSAGTLTVIRGMYGTVAATHLTGAAVTMPYGYGIDFNTKIAFSDVGASGDLLDYLSSSASDTKVQISAFVRDTAGVFQKETKTLTGLTAVNGTQAVDRIEFIDLAAVTTITSAPLTNVATSVTIATAGNAPASGTYYGRIGKEIVQVTGGQGTGTLTIARGQLGTTATAHQSGDNFYVLPLGDVAVVDHTKVLSARTAQTGSANATGTTPAIFKLQSGDGASISLGQVIVITSGTGSGQIRSIAAIYSAGAYGADVVVVSRNWTVVPDNTSVYQVYNGIQLDLAPNQICTAQRLMYNCAADIPGGSSRSFYQKFYAVNNNTTVAYTTANFQFASNTPALPAGAALDCALATALNDTVSAANRQTVLGSGYGSFVTQPAAVNVTTSSGNMAAGAAPNTAGAMGVLARLNLNAGTTSYKGSTDARMLGYTI